MNLEPDSIYTDAPIVLAPGTWQVPLDDRLRPTSDQVIKPLDTCGLGAPTRQIESPGGEYVLTAESGRDSGYDHGLALYISDRSGARTYVGQIYMYHQSDGIYSLDQFARWSPDGRFIVFTDFPTIYDVTPDASDFWLYSIDDGRRIDLRGEHLDLGDRTPMLASTLTAGRST